MINGQNLFDQPVRNNLITYDSIQKTATGQTDDCTTGCLLDYNYFKNCYNMIATGLTLSLPEKLENSIFEMLIIQQTLNINNSRTTRAKSINLHTIRKLIEYSLKEVRIKAMLTPIVLEILMSEGRSVLSPAQWGTRSERVK